ncbi:MAG TPA: hypothetical protein DDZ92_07150, partial [Halomonas sp.]|nr:hypothetical protein [Halomonas sp.]
IWGETDSAVEKAQKAVAHIAYHLQPGITNNIQRTLTAIQGETLPSGRELNPQDEMMAWLGWRASTMDPKASIYYRSFDFSDQMSEARSAITKPLRNLNDIDDSDIRDAVDDGRRRHEKAFREMSRVVLAARKSGMSDPEIARTLQGSGVSRQNIGALLNGQVPPMRLSPQSLAYAVKVAQARGDADFAQTIRDRYARARRELAATERAR